MSIQRGTYDITVMLGVLSYLRSPRQVLMRARHHSKTLILSFAHPRSIVPLAVLTVKPGRSTTSGRASWYGFWVQPDGVSTRRFSTGGAGSTTS